MEVTSVPHPNQLDILKLVVSHNGSVRAFSQTSGSTNCGVHAAEWVRSRILGEDFFGDKDGRVSKGGVQQLVVSANGVAPERGYKITNTLGDQAVIEITKDTSTADYEARASQLKKEKLNPIGGEASLFHSVDTYLKHGASGEQEGTAPAPIKASGDFERISPSDTPMRRQLAELALKQPGYYYLWLPGADSGMDHAAAMDSSDGGKLFIFDSLVGQLGFDQPANVQAWVEAESKWLGKLTPGKPVAWRRWTRMPQQ
jgi:hypothetical protein